MKPIRSAVTCSPGTRYAPETDTLWLALSNATVSCTTTATTVTVSLQAIGSVRVAVFLQEKMVMDFVCTDETKTIFIPCPSESVQQIQICKLSEPHYGILGVSALICDGGTCSPLPPAPHHLAFIGDSITCGYGIDAASPEDAFSIATELQKVMLLRPQSCCTQMHTFSLTVGLAFTVAFQRNPAKMKLTCCHWSMKLPDSITISRKTGNPQSCSHLHRRKR